MFDYIAREKCHVCLNEGVPADQQRFALFEKGQRVSLSKESSHHSLERVKGFADREPVMDQGTNMPIKDLEIGTTVVDGMSVPQIRRKA